MTIVTKMLFSSFYLFYSINNINFSFIHLFM